VSLYDVPLHAVLTELAEVYETVAALPPVVERAGGKVTGKPGSRVPPGVPEVLDADEHERAVTGCDDWALYVAHHLLDVEPGIMSVPDSTPGRLRLAARWAELLTNEPDIMARYAFELEAREHLSTMRRLARRANRRVPTHSACLIVTCSGTYAAVVDGPEVDGDLVCSRCGDRVPREQWERWGSVTQKWVTVEHAANMLGITVQAVWTRASRGKWRRTGTGRDVRYHVEDVEQDRVGGLSA
jgi:hypothetical protein